MTTWLRICSWIYWLKMTTTADRSHWEQLSTGSFMNPPVNLVLYCPLQRSFFCVLILTVSLWTLTEY
jgi:hypothetical protein